MSGFERISYGLLVEETLGKLGQVHLTGDVNEVILKLLLDTIQPVNSYASTFQGKRNIQPAFN